MRFVFATTRCPNSLLLESLHLTELRTAEGWCRVVTTFILLVYTSAFAT